MAAPLTRTELHDFNAASFTDPLNGQNTAATTRAFNDALIDSASNRLDDGTGSGGGDYAALAAKVETKLDKATGPNQRRGGPFYVIFLTQAEAVAAGRADNETLDKLDPALFNLGNTVRVDLHPAGNGVVLTLCYDARPAGSPGRLLVYLDGSFHGARTIPARWLAATDPAAVIANVPLLDPQRKDYPAGYLVRYPLSGQDYLFEAVAAGGPFAAPTTYAGTADWKGVALPTPPTVLSVTYPLGYVQYLLANNMPPTAGVLYVLPGTWNGGSTTSVVEVEAGQGGFAALGTLVAGATRTPVQVDVAAGAYSGFAGGAPPWVAGKQAAGSFVYSDGAVWRVKQDIANSQTAPTVAVGSTQYYEFIGSAAQQATVAQHTQQIADLQGRNTDQVPEGTTNFYFTFARSLATKLAGYAKAAAYRAIAATDTALVALGLLEKGLNDMQALIPPGATRFVDTTDPRLVPWLGRAAIGFDGSTTTGYDGFTPALQAGPATVLLNADSTLTKTISTGGYVISYGRTVTISDGKYLILTQGDEVHGTFFVPATPGSATAGYVRVYAGQAAYTLANAVRLVDGGTTSLQLDAPSSSSYAPIVVLAGNHYAAALKGTGTVYLYDQSDYGTADSTINVIGRRPTDGGGSYNLPQATANTLGGIKLGQNLTLNPNTGQVDAAGGGGAFTAGAGIDISNNVISAKSAALAANCVFEGFYGNPLNGTNGFIAPSGDARYWVPLNVSKDPGNHYTYDHYTATVAGDYLVSTFGVPGNASGGAIGYDLYAGASRNNTDIEGYGNWLTIAGSTRQGLPTTWKIHLNAGQSIGLVTFQLQYTHACIYKMSIDLFRAD